MHSLVSYLARKSKGGYARRDIDTEADVLHIGRRAASEIHLGDPRVPLDAAEIHQQPGGFFIHTSGQLSIKVNNNAVEQSQVKPGDVVHIGPYELEISEAPEGKEFAISVELIRPLGNDLQELQSRSKMSLQETWFSKRAVSWLLVLLVIGLFVAVPLAAFFVPEVHKAAAKFPVTPDKAWETGEISGPHKFFGNDCKQCHQEPFKQVKDTACVACHESIQHHGDPKKFVEASLDVMPACQSCHKEHNGVAAIELNDQRFCGDCHVDLDQRIADPNLLNVSDFGKDHPEFRPTVMVQHLPKKIARVSLDEPSLAEQSGLKFPHDKHLTTKDGGVRSPTGRRVMVCADCHVTEPGGYGMEPISMPENCSECHQLQFDKEHPERVLPHGKPKEVQAVLRDFYSAVALKGGVKDPSAPPAVRRRPGTPLTPEMMPDAVAWAKEQADKSISFTFGRNTCGYCHVVAKEPDESWTVKKPTLVNQWLPKGVFHHASHETVDCVQCHNAPESKDAKDVILPKVASCQGCHGGETATIKIPSTCIMCHQFHDPNLPPIHEKKKSAHAGEALSDRWHAKPVKKGSL